MKKAKILVVDDNLDARTGLEQYLSIEGFRIDSAESGEEALELLKSNKYNIVLTDLKMQDIDGLGVLEETQKLYPGTDVIIMTAYASVDTAVNAMKAGAYDYVSKPLNMDEIVVLLERCLEKQRLARELSGLKQIVKLYEVSQKLSAVTEVEELLSMIIKLAAEALSADGGSIMLYNPEAGELEVKVAEGSFKEEVTGKRFKLGDRFAGRAAELKKPVLSEDVRDKEWFKIIPRFEDIKSGMSVPMISNDKLIGLVNLKRTGNEKKFTEQDIKLLSIFAQQAAVSIENSYLFSDLKKEKDKLASLFSDMGDGAVMVDKNYRISVINKSAKLFLGLGQNDCAGKYLEEVLNGFIFSRPLDKLKISNQKTESFELRKEGPLPVYLSVTVSRIKDDKGLTVNTIFVIRDVTDRKKEEAVKKNFLRLMSHKLRTPLTSIIGFVEILEEKECFDQLDETGRKSVAVIEKESKHLSGLVDKLLRFTLLEAESLNLTLEKISLKELVNRALDSLGGLIKEKDVEVSLEGLSDIGSFEGDREKLQETLENLIENAVKFNDGKEKKLFIKGGVKEDGYISLSVIDNGPGIPPEKHEFIFEKFQQLEHFFTGQVEGMGLGLALVKRIVRAHRGKVEVKNSKGGGSEFKIIIPKTQK